MMTDPIADMLTRIRNANAMKEETVNIPTSKVKTAMLEILKKEGFIADFKSTADVKSVTTVTLKYTADNQRVIKGLKRISKPSLHVHTTAENLPRVLNGLGIAIISTSQGIMSDKEARAKKIGGEIIVQEEEVKCTEWLLPKDAMEKLTFESSKNILKKVIEDLGC